MAEEGEKKTDKKSPVMLFREKLADKNQLKTLVMEGLKSTNSKVRSLAAKTAFKLKDHEVIKKNVLPLLSNEKSKKVLRTVSDKITRKNLKEKVEKLLTPKHAKKIEEKTAEAAAAGEKKA